MDDDLAAILAGIREREQVATPGPWRAEPNTGAGRVWVQLGRLRNEADCEPLFSFRTLRDPVDDAERRRQYAQREADAAFIAAARTAIPLLLDAVEAALKLMPRWKSFASTGDSQDECADELREAIRAALLGKECTRE